ncbi:MAG TPA: 6-bladed beta-propeller [Longimicrobium sp.]|jgi:hypothetical protein
MIPRKSLALALLLGAAPLAAQPTVRLPAADRPLAGAPTNVFSIGAEEGQSWELLANVEQVAFDRNDNLYVLDRGNQRVLVFDRSGRFVRQLGRKGDGPGEFQIPVGLAVLGNGRVAVLDLLHGNITVLTPEGEVVGTTPLGEEWFPAMRIEAHPSGSVLAVLRPRIMPEMLRGGTVPPQNQTFALMPLDGRGELRRLFEIPDPASVRGSTSGGGNQRRFNLRMSSKEFAPLTLWDVLPDGGTALSHTTLYTIKIQDASGRTVRFLQRPVPVRRTTQADRDRILAQRREQFRTGRGGGIIMMRTEGRGGTTRSSPPRELSPQQIEEQLRDVEFADTIRAIQGMTVAPSGKLWIERTARNVGDPGPIDVVTPQGQYLGTIAGQRLPRAISASGRAAYVERDDLGVERVIVRQLPRNWYD